MKRLVELARAKREAANNDQRRRTASKAHHQHSFTGGAGLTRTKTSTNVRQTAEQKVAKRLSIIAKPQHKQGSLHVRSYSLPKEHTGPPLGANALISPEDMPERDSDEVKCLSRLPPPLFSF